MASPSFSPPRPGAGGRGPTWTVRRGTFTITWADPIRVPPLPTQTQTRALTPSPFSSLALCHRKLRRREMAPPRERPVSPAPLSAGARLHRLPPPWASVSAPRPPRSGPPAPRRARPASRAPRPWAACRAAASSRACLTDSPTSSPLRDNPVKRDSRATPSLGARTVRPRTTLRLPPTPMPTATPTPTPPTPRLWDRGRPP